MANKKVPAAKDSKIKMGGKTAYASEMVKGKGDSKMKDVADAKRNEGFGKKKR